MDSGHTSTEIPAQELRRPLLSNKGRRREGDSTGEAMYNSESAIDKHS